ncbi:MAG: methyltransferase [Deinococcaceae bacterium]
MEQHSNPFGRRLRPWGNCQNLSLHALLKGKTYTGIDIEPYFIRRAVAEHLGEGFTFLNRDFYDLDGCAPFDALLFILSLQHLGDIDRVLSKLRQLVKKDGWILAFDDAGSTRAAQPRDAHPE